jgi:hypothetical protein
MNDIDMSKPGTELFPEAQNNNSYGVNEPLAEAQPYNSGVTQQDVAGQQQMSDKEFNFRAMRDELAKMQGEREYYKGQVEAYKTTPSRVEPEAPKEDPFKNLDEEVRGAFESMRQENQRLKAEFQDQLSAIQAKAQRPDWDNVVTQHVPQLTSKNPIFAEMIRNTSNPYEAAYLLAELNARAQTGAPVQQAQPPYNPNAQRAIDNASKPQSLASVGGSGTLSNADYYASMSDKDFETLAARNLAGI